MQIYDVINPQGFFCQLKADVKCKQHLVVLKTIYSLPSFFIICSASIPVRTCHCRKTLKEINVRGLRGKNTTEWNPKGKKKLRWLDNDMFKWVLVTNIRFFIRLKTKGYRTVADFLSQSWRFFCRGLIKLKFVGTSACRTLADFCRD